MGMPSYFRAVEQEADRAAEMLERFVVSYRNQFLALKINEVDVPVYIAQEKRVLASLYHAARKAVPSPTRLTLLAYRYAVDATRPIADLHRFRFRIVAGRWCYGEFPPGYHSRTAGPAGGWKPVHPYWAQHILDAVTADPPDQRKVVSTVEVLFAGPPAVSDTLEAAIGPFEFWIDAEGRIHLQIGDVEVPGLGGKGMQPFLRHFCLNPQASIAGRALQTPHSQIKNASMLAKQLQQALGQVSKDAAEWFLTDPLHWSEGHAPIPRPESVNAPAR
jgi:hypothetical protein